VIFFLVPFLPRLPFLTGHMIEVNGELGNGRLRKLGNLPLQIADAP
jgi:hypothetical protein